MSAFSVGVVFVFAMAALIELFTATANDALAERLIIQQQAKPFKIENDAYEVHEWGVFPIARDAAWAKQDMLAEWKSFPPFFRGVLPGRALFSPSELSPPEIMIVTKPVVFIHNQNMTAIDMKVTFPKGRPVVWWPPAIEPSSVSQSKQTKHLRFKCVATGPLGEKTAVGSALMRVKMPSVDPKHWLNHLRNVKCSRVTVTGGKIHNSPDRGFAENFIYYDGVTDAPKSPTVERKGDDVLIRSVSDHDWHDVLVIERLNDRVRVSAWIDKIESGSQQTRVGLTDVTKAESATVAGFRKALVTRLVATGLNDDEADALVKVWGPGLFEQDGLLLFYRASQKMYDKWLPLELTPKPTNIVRVGLVVHAHLEPELEARVQRLIHELGDTEFQIRARADEQLTRIGGAAFKWIKQGTKSSDPEVAARCERILRENNAGQFVDGKEASEK